MGGRSWRRPAAPPSTTPWRRPWTTAPSDEGRTFTIVFFTDGQPTIGETNPDKILKNVAAKNTANTRIFTFGVGDDVNATFLDQPGRADAGPSAPTSGRPRTSRPR